MTKAMGARTSIQADRCHRCGGLMVPEQVFEIRSIDWRCISCANGSIRLSSLIAGETLQEVRTAHCLMESGRPH